MYTSKAAVVVVSVARTQGRYIHISAANQANEVISRQSTFEITPGSRQAVSGAVATVFGSTGFIGKELVNRLGRIGSQVVTPFRGDGLSARSLKLSGDLGAIVPMTLNVRDKSSIQRALSKANVVINCISSDFQTRNFSFDDVNVGVAAQIAEAAKEAGVPRLIHFSAAGANINSSSEFLASKARGERVVRDIFPEATIVRPTSVYGHEDRFLNRMADLINLGMVIPLVNKGAQLLQPVHVEDIGRAILQMLTSAESVGQTYELGGYDIYSRKQLMDMIATEINKQYYYVGVSDLSAKLLAYASELLPPKYKVVTRDQLQQMETDVLVNTGSRTFTDLDITPTRLESLLPFLMTMHKIGFDERPHVQ